MKLWDLDDDFLTTGEIELLDTWCEDMKKNPIGKRIIENMKQDPHVPEDIREKFLKNLSGRIMAGDNELEAVKNSITDDMLLKGPSIEKENLPDTLSMLMKTRSLFRYLNDNLTLFRDINTHGLIFNWIKNKTLTIEKNFKKVKLQGRQPVCWSIFTHDVDDFLNISDINELCDGLGFPDFNEGDYVVELLYEKKNIKNPRIPTIMEAGVYPIFCPGSEEEEYGATEQGIPEIVHDPIHFQDIDLISCKEKKDKDGGSFYEELKNGDKELKIPRINKAVSILEDMDTQELMKYIEERLNEINFIPPLCTRSNEPPEYFLEKVYEKSQNSQFKSIFREGIAKLLAKEQIEISEPDYLAVLLIFCERYTISEAFIPVEGMVLSGKLKGKESICGDLHHRALMALARMPGGLKMTELWVEAIRDERYTAAAFAALREHGLDKIISYLPNFIRLHQKKPDCIDMEIALLTLYVSYKVHFPVYEITNLILHSVKNENQVVKNHLYSILNKPLLIYNDFENEIKILPPGSEDLQLFSLKSLLCFKLLSYIELETDQVTHDVKVWILIAMLVEKSSRQAKWSDLIWQIEQGKFIGIRF
ncbi:MAG: hypothetical protein PVH61_05230 [Candidatus Aminicenantes bacterium]|jgi:hypothetical protein